MTLVELVYTLEFYTKMTSLTYHSLKPSKLSNVMWKAGGNKTSQRHTADVRLYKFYIKHFLKLLSTNGARRSPRLPCWSTRPAPLSCGGHDTVRDPREQAGQAGTATGKRGVSGILS